MTPENHRNGEAGEIVDATHVAPAGVAIERRASAPLSVARASGLPTVQAAAVAATGFVAGAAAVAVVSRSRGRRLPLRRKRRSGLGQIVSSNSFLVDVHVLKR